MLQIWGRRNSNNVMPVMWAVGELGIPHERYNVGGSFKGNDTPDYLAMNPNGKIPVIKDGGFVLFESQAIIRYLAAKYGKGTLAPEDPQAFATADQWMEWYKTTFFTPFLALLVAVVRTDEDKRDPEKIQALNTDLAPLMDILDAQLAKQAFVAGNNLTMADIPLGGAVYRYYEMDVPHHERPHIRAWQERLRTRPAFQEHVMFPFGRNLAEWNALEQAAPGATG